MRPPRVYEQWQIDFITKNASKLTFSQLSDKVKIPIPTLQIYCKQNQLTVKYAHVEKEPYSLLKKITRPPAVYNQSCSPFGIADSLHGKFLTN